MYLKGKSIQGRRKSNQDSIVFRETNGCFIAAVADGMGGFSGGEIASRTVIDSCVEHFGRFASAPEKYPVEDVIENIVSDSQRLIREKTEGDSKLERMGSTLAIVVGRGSSYVVGNIGDSQTYLISSSDVRQLSIDHSYAQEYREKYKEGGAGEGDDSFFSKISNVLTRSISGGDDKPDIYPGRGEFFDLEEGDVLILCSDGLVFDKSIDIGPGLQRIAGKSKSADQALDAMIDWAYSNGSKDNISVVLVTPGEWKVRKKPRFSLFGKKNR